MNKQLAVVLGFNNGWELLRELIEERMKPLKEIVGESYTDREKWLNRLDRANGAIQELQTLLREIEVLKEEFEKSPVGD